MLRDIAIPPPWVSWCLLGVKAYKPASHFSALSRDTFLCKITWINLLMKHFSLEIIDIIIVTVQVPHLGIQGTLVDWVHHILTAGL